MLTVNSLIEEVGLGLLAGRDAADAPIRWVHISELIDPTPWLSLRRRFGQGILCGGWTTISRLASISRRVRGSCSRLPTGCSSPCATAHRASFRS